MKTIINEIFGEILSNYNKLLEATGIKDTTKDTARNRLKLVLMHDRTKLAPETMTKMRDELVEVISRYVEIDKEALDLNLASEGNSIALMASIPVKRAKEDNEDKSIQEDEDLNASNQTQKDEVPEEDDEKEEIKSSHNPISKEANKNKKSKSQKKEKEATTET